MVLAKWAYDKWGSRTSATYQTYELSTKKSPAQSRAGPRS
jgi:hypothetical protein